MIDTHSHIYAEEFDADRTDVVRNAQAVGVQHIILANEDSTTLARMHATKQQFPDFCSLAVGLHPENVKQNFAQEIAIVGDELATQRYCAVGEIGLDFYWDTTFTDQQIRAFEDQIDLALTFDLPVILHVRKAFAETFASLARFKGKPLRGVFHCFGGGVEEARKAIALGFCLGVGGVFTYKNTNLREILAPIGLNHLLLETDAPFLAPVPHRGQRNEPQFVVEVARKMAELFQTTFENVDATTTKNAQSLFNLDQ